MKPRTDACCSLSVQSSSNTETLDQNPPHRSHSRIGIVSILSDCSFTLHRGQSPGVASSSNSAGYACEPQCPQNLLPRNIMPMQATQPTVLRRERQYSH